MQNSVNNVLTLFDSVSETGKHYVTVHDLQRLKNFIKLGNIAVAAQIPPQSLYTAVNRGYPLSTADAVKITDVLEKLNINFR